MAGGVAGIVAISGGIAAANWNAAAAGFGTAKALSAVQLTITAVAAPTAELYPGFTGPLHFTITNTNPYPVSLNGWTTGAITSSDPTNCAAVAANVTVAASGTLGTAIPVLANATTTAQVIPAAITMPVTAANGCQGVLFTVALSMTGTQT